MIVSRALRIALVLVACLSIASPAYAYLDPGTGSMLISAVLGVAAALALAVKMFWYRLIGLFRGKRPAADKYRVRRDDPWRAEGRADHGPVAGLERLPALPKPSPGP